MSAATPSSSTAQAAPPRHFLCTALVVAALANALVPGVLFSFARFFGHVGAHQRALVIAVVVVEYAIAFLLILLHANVGFASGYAVATAGVVTLCSAALTCLVLSVASWNGSAPYSAMIGLTGFAFSIVSNAVFLVAAIRWARAIHPRLHLGGFSLGIAASIALVIVYVLSFQ